LNTILPGDLNIPFLSAINYSDCNIALTYLSDYGIFSCVQKKAPSEEGA